MPSMINALAWAPLIVSQIAAASSSLGSKLCSKPRAARTSRSQAWCSASDLGLSLIHI